jgi:hypothetical protein
MDSTFNFFLLGAILLQGAVSAANRKTGAVVGYLITTGILIWGLVWYGQSSPLFEHYLTYFGQKLSVGGFLAACLVWYGIDTIVLVSTLRDPQKGRKPARQRPRLEPPDEPEEEEPKRAARKPAALATSPMTVCPKCGMKVFPKADGACPSCHAQIA